MIKLETKNPIAYHSADHKFPQGSISDNNTNSNYIAEIKSYFNNQKINIMDLGCSGGQIVIDHHNLGDISVGLEGSDTVLQNSLGSYNWSNFHNKNLFLCDITEDFRVTDENGEIILFDVIQMWDVLEHIPEDRIKALFDNINKHLKKDGIFIGQISQQVDPIRHVSNFSWEKWKSIFLENGFKMDDYSFRYTPRPRLNNRTLDGGVPDPNATTVGEGFSFMSMKIK